MKRLAILLALTVPASATDYTMNLDTGYYNVVVPPPTPLVIVDSPVTQQCGIEEPVCLVTPLPSTIVLFSTGLAGLAFLGRRRKS